MYCSPMTCGYDVLAAKIAAMGEAAVLSIDYPLAPIGNVTTILDAAEQAFWEGCLSVPDLRGVVHRPRAIRVDYLDMEGNPCAIEAEGFVATVLQHELDHLQGVLYVDRMRTMRALATLEEYRRYWADQPVPEFE